MDERRVHNELFFRTLNESIERVGEEVFGDSEAQGAHPYDFVCECHVAQCRERVPLTVPEYEHIRGDSRQFVVFPASEHVDPTNEEIVDQSSRYWVVRKTGEAGRIAAADDEAAPV